MTNEKNLTGYYGKLPLRGDFIHRNLDDGFVKMWDNWLQIVINNSREILGDQWLDAYLVSPIWRFYLPLRDSKAYCGIMLPSVDKVGRYFPLAIAKTVVDSIYSPDFIRHQQSWFDNAERLALLALDEQISFENFNLSIDALADNDPPPAIDNGPLIHKYRFLLTDNSNLGAGLSCLCQLLTHSLPTQHSFWWTLGTEHIEGNLLCCDNMPDDNMYTAMLDGQWSLCHIQTLAQ